MICFNDTTYCSSPNCENKCGRKLTAEVLAAAAKWCGGDDPPIATANFCEQRPEIDTSSECE